jgi:hypothetical protein
MYQELCGRESRANHRGYQHRRNRGLIAQIPQSFAGEVECVTRELDRFPRIVSEPAGETINGWIITSNQCIKTSLCCFHTIHLVYWSKTTDLSLQFISVHDGGAYRASIR